MPPILSIAGMSTPERAALIRLLAGRGYRIGAIVSNDYARLVDGVAQEYMAAGATCVSVISSGHFVTVLPERTSEDTIQHLFTNCHLVLTDRETLGCADIIEVAPSEGMLRYAGDRRLRAVIGEGSSVPGVPCFAHGMQEQLCDFIENRYLKPLLSAAVLAGGKSSRLGTNKALLKVGNRLLIEHVLTTVRSFADEVRIIANDSTPYENLNLPVAPDIKPGGGPLSGIHAALSLSRTDYVLVVSCDLPMLDHGCIERLVLHYPGYDITLYKHKQFEPLCAIYRRTCIGPLEELIEHGDYRIIDLFPTLNVKVIRTDNSAPFKNINTLDDYQEVLNGEEVLRDKY